MKRNLNQFYVTGTSALKLYESKPAHATTARIVKLPRIERVDAKRERTASHARTSNGTSRSSRLKKILDASEMYCSLITEDFRGCSYNLFSKQNVQVLAAAGSAIAVISLFFGV